MTFHIANSNIKGFGYAIYLQGLETVMIVLS